MSLVQNVLNFISTIGPILKGKQDKLISGDNISTINGNSLLTGVDIVISGGVGTLNWVDVVVGGTFIGDLGNGIFQYSYNGTTYYREVIDEPYTDKIFSDIGLTTLVSERG